MNTPLLLALKQGNLEIAKTILEKAVELEVDINQKDGRGLTALDWACILRQNDIIKMILLVPSLNLPKDSYAKAIYFQSANQDIFTQFLKDIKKYGIEKEIPERGYPSLYIFTQEPYSDLIYFMRDICINLKIVDAKDFPNFDGIASHVWFYKCFEIGYHKFCELRNQMTVDQTLLNAMLSQETLESWRKTTHQSFERFHRI